MHFAAFAYVGESGTDPALYYRNNVVGTLALLDAMRYAEWGFDYLKYDWCSYGSIAPRRPNVAEMQKPYEVMRDALAKGGTSFDSLYVNVNGESGYFDRSLDAYGREGEPCRRCGAVMRREKFMNRSSFYCPRCQPRPRR